MDRPRILYIQHELYTWGRAKMWSHNLHLGMEAGFEGNDIDFVTLATTWLPRAKEILAGEKFDQVWINDIIHAFEPGGCGGYQASESDLAWIAGLAPVRLGIITETVQYSKEENAANPSLENMKRVLGMTIQYMTHIAAIDEQDLVLIKSLRDIPAIMLVPSMPERFINRDITLPPIVPATFIGTPYGERARWLDLPDMKQVLTHQISPDNQTDIPRLFDELHGETYRRCLNANIPIREFYNQYICALRALRSQAFSMYLEGMRLGSSVVHLPAYCKVYNCRVYEGMACGRPVITSKGPGRPMLDALFTDGEDILLYPPDDPDTLMKHIVHVIDDPDFGRNVAMAARDKLLKFHTTEKRAMQFLEWIENGTAPVYEEESSAVAIEIAPKTPLSVASKKEVDGMQPVSNYQQNADSGLSLPGGKGKLRVLFISPPYARFMGLENFRFPITFGSMATILSMNGHNVAIYDADFDRGLMGKHGNYEYTFTHQHMIAEALENDDHFVWQEIMEQVEKFKPDVVGISTMTNKYPMAVKIAEITKSINPGIQIVIGGHHASIFGEKLLEDKNIDFAVYGEGEITFLELINRFCDPEPDFSNIDGLIYKNNGQIFRTRKRDLIKNLDILSIADRDLMLNENYISENNLMISRGCPFDCNYCGAKIIWQRRVRKKSIPEVIKEIEYLFARSNSKSISFWDDSFTHDRKYIFELLGELKKFEGLSFSCITRLDLIDREMLLELKKTGCTTLLFGVESGNDEILKLINKKATLDSIRKNVAVVNSVGIPWIGFFIMGYPGETKENILETLNFMRELNPNYAEINIYNPLPGTQTWNELEKKGLVSSDMDFSKISQASSENFFVKDMTKEEFRSLALYMAREFDKHNKGSA
jgi:radical SAM superfamily enzyme YgiQ (UPF0313 family)